MRDRKVLFLTQGAVIAALYVVLTVLFAPVSFREIQVRVSEMLTVLPFFTPAAVPGLFVGCIVANILGGAIPLDVICGSVATLIGAAGTYLIGRAVRKAAAGGKNGRGGNIGRSAAGRLLATLPPVISNVIIVPLVLYYGYGVSLPIPLQMLTVGIGEVISCCGFGGLLMAVLEKYGGRIFRAADARG